MPYAETMGAFKDLYDEGVVQRVGLSNANPDQIREAHGILGDALVSVQNQLSPSFRTSEPELDLCNELGLAFLPWSPLGGMRKAHELGEEFRPFAEVAQAHGVSPHQVAIAWLLAKSPNVVPIPGASRPASIRDSAAAVHVELHRGRVRRAGGQPSRGAAELAELVRGRTRRQRARALTGAGSCSPAPAESISTSDRKAPRRAIPTPSKCCTSAPGSPYCRT